MATAGIVLGFCWQFLAVHFLYQGNWTGLFYTGGEARLPPALASEHIYRFPNVAGYDGQFYHLLAHDPFFQKGFSQYLDFPRRRAQRILVPAIAHLLSFGHDEWTDPAYIAVTMAFIFLGIYWLARWSASHNHSVFWGWLFLITPAALVSIHFVLVDAAQAALTMGIIWYAEQKSDAKLYLALAWVPLARETGIFLLLGWCAWLLLNRQWRVFIFATAALPTLLWTLFVQRHAPPNGPLLLSFIPFLDLVSSVLHPWDYRPGLMRVVLLSLDHIAQAGMLLAFAFVVRDALRRKTRSPWTLAGVGFALIAAFLSDVGVWPEVACFGRVFTPVLLIVAMPGILSGNWWRLAPLAMIIPRVAVIFAAHGADIVRSALHGH